MKNLNLANPYIRLASALVILVLLLGFLFVWDATYLGENERSFQTSIEKNQSFEGNLLVDDVTEFEWDIVCISASDGLGHYFSRKNVRESDLTKINDTRMALAFFKHDELVELLDFRQSEVLDIDGRQVRWNGHFRPYNCLSNKEASFKVIEGKSNFLLSFQPKHNGDMK